MDSARALELLTVAVAKRRRWIRFGVPASIVASVAGVFIQIAAVRANDRRVAASERALFGTEPTASPTGAYLAFLGGVVLLVILLAALPIVRGADEALAHPLGHGQVSFQFGFKGAKYGMAWLSGDDFTGRPRVDGAAVPSLSVPTKGAPYPAHLFGSTSHGGHLLVVAEPPNRGPAIFAIRRFRPVR